MATVKHVENVPQTQLDTNMAKTKPVKTGMETGTDRQDFACLKFSVGKL